MSDSTDPDDLKQRFDELIQFIDEASAKIQNGDMTDLGNLDKAVTALCSEIEIAGTETAKEMQPAMAKMITKLDELAQSINAYQEKQQEEG